MPEMVRPRLEKNGPLSSTSVFFSADPKHLRHLRHLRNQHLQPSVRTLEGGVTSPAQLDLALRTLARVFVRAQQSGDPGANVGGKRATTSLTVDPNKSAHHGDEAA